MAEEQKTEVLSVRVPADVKQKVLELIDKGGFENNKDGIEYMAALFEAELHRREGTNQLFEEAQQVQYHQQKINNIINGVAEKLNFQKELYESQLAELRDKYNQMVENLNEQTTQFKEELREYSEAIATTTKENEKLAARNADLEQSASSHAKTVELYQDTIGSLKDKLERLADLDIENADLTRRKEQLTLEVDSLKTAVYHKEREMEAQANAHQQELAALKEKAESMMEKALMEQQVKYVNQFSEEREKLHNALLEAVAAAEKKCEERLQKAEERQAKMEAQYEKQIEKLTVEIEALRQKTKVEQ